MALIALLQRLQERDQIRFVCGGKAVKVADRRTSLATVRRNRGGQIVGAAVVQIEQPFGQSPQWRGAPLASSGLPEGNAIGEARPHVVQEKIGIGKDGLAAKRSNSAAQASGEIGYVRGW